MESWLSKIKSLLDKIKFLLVKFCAGLLLAVANPAEQEFKLVEQEFYLAEQAFNLARQFLNLAQQAFCSLSLFLCCPTTRFAPPSSIPPVYCFIIATIGLCSTSKHVSITNTTQQLLRNDLCSSR